MKSKDYDINRASKQKSILECLTIFTRTNQESWVHHEDHQYFVFISANEQNYFHC